MWLNGLNTLNSNIHWKVIKNTSYYFDTTADMIVDYKDEFYDGLNFVLLQNNSVFAPCVVYKIGNYVGTILHVFDAYSGKEAVFSVLDERIVKLYSN